MRKNLIYTILAMLAVFSCGREILPDSFDKGTGDLVIRIASTKTGTKAGTAADGDVMKNLHVWVVDYADKVVRYASWSGVDGDIVMDSGDSTATVTFTNIERNSYTVYLIANKPSALAAPAVNSTISDSFRKYVLSGFDSNAPSFGEDGMPLSLIESISISAGSNSLNAELIRTCGRIRVSIRNNTKDKNIFLQSVVLGDKNPNKGFLFQQDDHSVPDGISYTGFNGSFRYTSAGETVTRYIAPGSMDTVIDQYIYESGVGAVEDMTLNLSGGVFEDTVTSTQLGTVITYTYTAGTEFTKFYSSNISKTGLYIIRNCAQNYFLKSSGSIMLEKFFSSAEEFLASDNVKDYLWQFNYSSILTSGTGASYSTIQNYSTGNYINITNAGANAAINLTSTAQTLIIGTQAKGMLIRYNGTNDKVYATYTDNARVFSHYLAADVDNVYWYMTPVTEEPHTGFGFVDAVKSFTKVLPNINYINDFGVTVPLTQICRNEDINIIINVYYNPEYAIVYFEVAPWEDDDNETTFD